MISSSALLVFNFTSSLIHRLADDESTLDRCCSDHNLVINQHRLPSTSLSSESRGDPKFVLTSLLSLPCRRCQLITTITRIHGLEISSPTVSVAAVILSSQQSELQQQQIRLDNARLCNLTRFGAYQPDLSHLGSASSLLTRPTAPEFRPDPLQPRQLQLGLTRSACRKETQ